MTKFVLVEHSLRNVGGHHYEYASHVLREAERAGYECVLATHRSFRERGSLAGTWPVYPLFCHDVYSKYADSWNKNRNRSESPSRGRHDTEATRGFTRRSCCNPATWLRGCRQLAVNFDRARRLDRFVSACSRLFRSVSLQAGDVVFFATLSEFDLQALTKFLRQNPSTRVADWHAQFHFDVLRGRATDDDSHQLQAMRCLFDETLQQIPQHRLFFHCTTAQLATQFNRVIPGAFHELPYPVNPQCYSHDKQPAATEPLKITCAGGMRREKGSHSLAALIRESWRPYLAPGRVQFHIQTNKRRFKSLLPKNEAATDDAGRPRLVRVPHPLAMEEYVRLIRESDIGLFLYDSETYYTRCSGILVEMLAAGTPVIVPAGCWLSEQVAEPNFRHLDRIRERIGVGRLLGIRDVIWDKPVNGHSLRLGDSALPLGGELSIPEKATGLMVRFRHGENPPPGTYVRMEVAQYDQQTKLIQRSVEIIGQRAGNAPVGAFIPLSTHATMARLMWSKAWGAQQTEISGLELGFANTGHTDSPRLPAGAVGLIAADEQQIPRLLEEMIQHYAHYRESAELFSHEWMQRHSARQTFATLVSRSAGLGDLAKESQAA